MGSSSNCVQIDAKRDDLMSLGGGGHKLRKLEFLLGDAAAAGADTIIATGGRQSNFARLAAAAAAKLGLVCELVLSRMVPRGGDEYDRNGNVLLDDLFGARIHDLPAGVDSTHFAQERAEELRVAGHITYVATLGGSSPIGCVGYADCASYRDAVQGSHCRIRCDCGSDWQFRNTCWAGRGIPSART